MISSIILIYIGLYLVVAYSNTGHNNFKYYINKILPSTVVVSDITIGHYGLEPTFKLQDVVIFNTQHTEKLLQVPELQIGIDWIGSLLTRQIKPNLFLVRGAKLTGNQDNSGKINFPTIPFLATLLTDNNSLSSQKLSLDFLEQCRIFLKDIALEWQVANGTIWQFKNINLYLYNDLLQHKLILQGKCLHKQKDATIFSAKLRFNGNILQYKKSSLLGNIIIDNWLPDSTVAQPINYDFLPDKGNIDLHINNSRLHIKQFRQPLIIKKFLSNVIWQKNPRGLSLTFDKFYITDHWLTITGKEAQISFDQQNPMPTVDIQLNFKLSDMAKAHLYYPIDLLPSEVVTWLDQAFIKSKQFTGNMVLRGTLDKFPFDNAEGKFTVDTNLHGVHLRYDPSWPQIYIEKGKMLFTGRSLEITAQAVKTMQETARFVTATIPNLELPILVVNTYLKHIASTNALKFIANSPLKNTLNLKNISLSGMMHLGLKLMLPLADNPALKKAKINGTVELINNALHLYDNNWQIEKLSGDIYFDANNIIARKLKGSFFAQPILITVETAALGKQESGTEIRFIGNAPAHNFSKTLDPYAEGNITYQGLLTLSTNKTKTPNVLEITSDLQGVKLKLPSPLYKSATEVRPLFIKYQFDNSQQTFLTIDYDKQLVMNLVLNQDNVKKLTTTADKNNSGIIVAGELSKCDLKSWYDFLTKWWSQNRAQITTKIKEINLKIKELVIWQQNSSSADLKITPKDTGWNISFVNQNIDGEIFMPSNKKGTIRANFNKLFLPGGQGTFKPLNLPKLDIKIADFTYENKKFTNVLLNISPLQTGIKIDKLKFGDAKYNVEGAGVWTITQKQSSTTLQGSLDTSDCGDLLRMWGFADSLNGGNGSITFKLSSPNSPYQLDPKNMQGMLSFNIANGKIINLSSSTKNKLVFNRVFNLFSLQSLMQQFFSNLRNITQRAFTFTTLNGECELNNGIVRLLKLNIDGSDAYIMAYGTLDLKKREYDLKLSITSRLSLFSTAGLLGGPVVAIAGLVVDDILTKVVKKQTHHYNYRITGSWDNPIITKT